MKYPLTILLLILFLFLSCSEEQTTGTTGSTPATDYMSFTLTNSDGTEVSTTAQLSRGSTYGLVIKPEGGALLSTANYDVSFTPADIITINVIRTNSIDFTVNNTNATSVTITAVHSRDDSITESLVLNLAPRADFMNFVLSNIGGHLLATNTPLVHGNSYVVTVNPTSESPLPTADYDISFMPGNGITQLAVNTNSISFRVENGTTELWISAVHKDNPIIRRFLFLNFVKDFMSFTLTNSGGTEVSTTAQLSRGSTYGLVIKPEGGASLSTANYDVSFTPTDIITINVIRTNSIEFTVNNTSDMTVTIKVTHKNNTAISETLRLSLPSSVVNTFQQDIENATTVPSFIIANALTREVLESLGANPGATLEKRYVTEAGAETRNGSSWDNAWAATNLRNNINGISDASPNKVYLVMIAGGTYKPTYGTSRKAGFIMKNYVAIMGGFEDGGGWERTGTTIFSGDIGIVNDNSDNSYHVFYHNSISLGNSHLYGVTITNGNADGSDGGGMFNTGSDTSPHLTRVTFSGNTTIGSGGGMYNTQSAAPVLNRVVFSGNTAVQSGGGMYNNSSSPVLNQVVFSGNTARSGGGGIFNSTVSSLKLTGVVFSGNSAANGGGMYNDSSSMVLNRVVFSGNSAISGGGIYNLESDTVLVGVVFNGNSAANGGGMLNENNGQVGPRILNTIFFGNTTNGGMGGVGPDIAMNSDSSGGAENITIAGSVLGTYLTTGKPTNVIVGFSGSGAININYHHLKNSAVNLTGTATLTVNGMNFTYPTITSGSSAIDLGLYVRKNGNGDTATYYYSEDNATWYTGFTTAGGWGSSGTPPANAEDLSATDITGKAVTGRPDAGANEF